ncbi:hypothetical protein ACH4E7_39215 [Kitasatospora sp. NPDC018058]|uniref:hypothetical protein n=1 Tax=Kitasatospora sp. NPDC018058 TaxID=3364025 RepID=UPI0037C180B4
MTGDHDIFDLQDADGFRIGEREAEAAVDDMMARDMGVQHGGHRFWVPEGTFNQAIFDRIVRSHQAGGEALLRFVPGLDHPIIVSAEPETRLSDGRAHLGPFAGDPRRHGQQTVSPDDFVGDPAEMGSRSEPSGGTGTASGPPRPGPDGNPGLRLFADGPTPEAPPPPSSRSPRP